ncbi:hypothetical protein F4Y19_02710 [Candidatus Poribacteria bacterium]|nr:hypothetical protein [Candidatus Poribacteria bacterium]
MNTNNHSIKSVARYPHPVLMGAFKQLRQMWLQTITTGILTVSAIVSVLKFEKVIVDITQVVKHIAQTHVLRMLAYLIFGRSETLFLFSFLFHWVSRITPLTPTKWVGNRHIVKRQCFVCLPT